MLKYEYTIDSLINFLEAAGIQGIICLQIFFCSEYALHLFLV